MIIGITGGLKAGKKQLCLEIGRRLKELDVAIISMNDYFKNCTNHPYQELIIALKSLKDQNQSAIVYGKDLFLYEDLRDLIDLKIFLDVDSDIRLSNMVSWESQGSTIDLIDHYLFSIKPDFDNCIYPTIKFADLIIPRGKDNQVAIRMLVDYLNHKNS